MILSGELRPGDRLPAEKELSDSLGLSRNSMREAIKALELIRVIDVRRGDGTYVTSLDPSLLVEAIAFVVDLQADASVLQLFAARRILEGGAAALAASRITEPELEDLRAQMAEVTDAHGIDDLVAHDLQFHHSIVAASGNPFLTTMSDSLSGETTRARVWRGLTQLDAVPRTIAEHQGILNALAAGDSFLAQSLVAAHIAGVELWLRATIEETPE